MRFCFTLLGMMAMTAYAADSSEAYARGKRVTTVIRADERTGKLVRSVVVTPRTVPQPKAIQPVAVTPRVVNPVVPLAASEAKLDASTAGSLNETVAQIAADQQLPAELIHSVIKVESNYNPKAVSPKGAQGLMQLIPATARRFGVADAFNPVDNIQGGARYLKYLLDLHGGNYALALAAYNAGEGAVARYGDIPPYPETRNYVQSVAEQLRKNIASKFKTPAAKPEPKLEVKDSTRIVEIRQPDGSVRYVSQ
jgi:soluble lytic murein transglycosylase-like protein